MEIANEAEEKWIEFYKTRNPESGFNLAKGGSHVPHPIRKNPWDDPEYRIKAFANISKNFVLTTKERSVRSKDLWQNPTFQQKISRRGD